MSEINKNKYPFLYKYGRNLTEDFRHADDIKAIIVRDKEIRQAIEILAQKEKNNLLLTGLPGVGGRLGVLRQGDDLPAGDRPAQGVFQDR